MQKSDHAVRFFTYENDHDLFATIVAWENAKLLENNPEFGLSQWSFIYHNPKRVVILHEHTPAAKHTAILKQAFAQGAGFAEICRGDYRQEEEVIIDRQEMLDALRKQWCLDYCQTHGYHPMRLGVRAAPASPASLTYAGQLMH